MEEEHLEILHSNHSGNSPAPQSPDGGNVEGQPLTQPSFSGPELVFKNVVVTIGEKTILDNICGSIRAGELLSLMGPSGSGKTSLLNFLSFRHELLGAETKIKSADLLINGEKMTKRYGKKIGFVMQHDILFQTITLRETLEFYTMVKLPRSMTRVQKLKRTMELVELMDLGHCLDTIIGGGLIRGLSGGEKKRASILIEMISDPDLLFLDEPTSGLDSSMSMVLIQSLKKLTSAKNKAIISSIHQPNSQIFFSFDKLLLLAGGKMAYYGNPNGIVPFFASLSYVCPKNWNASDYMLDLVRSDVNTIENIVGACKEGLNMEDFKATVKNQLKNKKELLEIKKQKKNLKPSFNDQFNALIKRSFSKSLKSTWTFVNIIKFFLVAIVIGIVFFQTKVNDMSIEILFGLLFFGSASHFMDSFFGNVLQFNDEFIVVKKEYISGTYNLFAYYLGKVISEGLINIFRPILMWTIVYWMAGLHASHWFLASLSFHIISEFVGQGTGLLVGSFGLSFPETITVAVIYSILVTLVGGFYSRSLPFWLSWIKFLSPIHYNYVLQIWIQAIAMGGISCAAQDPSLGILPGSSPFFSCNQNLTRARPEEIMDLLQVNIHAGWYVLMAFSLLFLSHFGAIFSLWISLNRKMNAPSLEQRIFSLIEKQKRKKKANKVFIIANE